MPKHLLAFLSELPPAPNYNPVAKAIDKAANPEVSAALQLFASMPPSTGVLANPVRYHHTVSCGSDPLELSIRSFAFRGCLMEEDIITEAADTMRVIFVGLFGRFDGAGERRSLSQLLSRSLHAPIKKQLPTLAKFIKSFPDATADTAMQYMASIRKAKEKIVAVNPSVPPPVLLQGLIRAHLENCAAVACSSFMRSLLRRAPHSSAGLLLRQTRRFIESLPQDDAFLTIFSLLLRRKVNPTEARILRTLGTIQIHHGSAGSNMVTRYLASLHTKNVSDIFIAGQMTLDCARHFGAIAGMTEFVKQLERVSPARRDELIRQRAIKGDLPTFGHPEIAAAGRTNRLELDPRPAIYLFPLFEAIDAGKLEVPKERMRRVEIVQRIYQLAFVEGIEKPGRSGLLRIAPNTDFGAWIVQESLGIEEKDRTLLSYVFRGFGWMMDVREQLQQPIIRPVIPPEPNIVPPPVAEGVLPDIVDVIHARLSRWSAFVAAPKTTREQESSYLGQAGEAR